MVATDSQEIHDLIVKLGGEVFMSQQIHECGTDRIAEAVRDLKVDVIVNVQGDEPFTHRDDLAGVLQILKDDAIGEVDLASLMTPIHHTDDIENYNAVKVVTDAQRNALLFSRCAIPHKRNKDARVPYYKHKGIYAFRKEALLDFASMPITPLEEAEKIECLRFLENGKRIRMAITTNEGVEIDTPEDLERARQIMKS